jgi:hypothetical protein
MAAHLPPPYCVPRDIHHHPSAADAHRCNRWIAKHPREASDAPPAWRGPHPDEVKT